MSPNSSQLSRPQKIAVTILGILAVLIVVFWVWQMRAQINKPFSIETENKKTTDATSTEINTVLKNRDTDQDSLSDYDELYTHKTSPYLEDTDSDNLSDALEIKQGTDPNCPQGQSCTTSVSSSSTASSSTLYSNSADTDISVDSSSSSTDATVLQSALNGQIDAATLRQLLISGGADKTELDAISDTDLMQGYQEALTKQSQTSTQ